MSGGPLAPRSVNSATKRKADEPWRKTVPPFYNAPPGAEAAGADKENSEVSLRSFVDGRTTPSASRTIVGHQIDDVASVDLGAGLSPRLASQSLTDGGATVPAHELMSYMTSVSSAGGGSVHKRPDVRGFRPEMTPSCVRASEAEGWMSVNTKVKKTEDAIGRVKTRLAEAERRAGSLPKLEQRMRELQLEADQAKSWRDEVVIYKRMVSALQEKLACHEQTKAGGEGMNAANADADVAEPRSASDATETDADAGGVAASDWTKVVSDGCRVLERVAAEHLGGESLMTNVGVCLGLAGVSFGVATLVWSGVRSTKRLTKMIARANA